MGIYFKDEILGIKCMNYSNKTFFKVEGKNCIEEAKKRFDKLKEDEYIFLVLREGTCTYDYPPENIQMWTPDTEKVLLLLKSSTTAIQ